MASGAHRRSHVPSDSFCGYRHRQVAPYRRMVSGYAFAVSLTVPLPSTRLTYSPVVGLVFVVAVCVCTRSRSWRLEFDHLRLGGLSWDFLSTAVAVAGSIPKELGRLGALKYLWLCCENISGRPREEHG